MRKGMALAQAATEAGATPVGAVVFDPATGEVLGEGANQPIGRSPLARSIASMARWIAAGWSSTVCIGRCS